MTVTDLARQNPIAATRNASIAEVASLMRDEQVGSVVITDEHVPVGIVTDRDITVDVTAEGMDPDGLTAQDVMTTEPVTVEKDAGRFELIETMSEHEVRRMPVVEDGELWGIITLDDIDRLLSDEQRKLASIIEAESPSY